MDSEERQTDEPQQTPSHPEDCRIITVLCYQVPISIVLVAVDYIDPPLTRSHTLAGRHETAQGGQG